MALYAPETTPAEVLSIGPYDLGSHFSGATLLGIKKAYVDGLRGAWALSIALWGVAFFCAFLSKWPGRMVPPQEDSRLDGEGTDEIGRAHV